MARYECIGITLSIEYEFQFELEFERLQQSQERIPCLRATLHFIFNIKRNIVFNDFYF